MIMSASLSIREFFDSQYRRHPRYWWRRTNRYSLDPADHTTFNSVALRIVATRGPGRALDVGAGEGADAIRLAKLGYEVDVMELSTVACEKIERFARAERVRLTVRNESAFTAGLAESVYDVVVMNGLLHYIKDKDAVLRRLSSGSASGAVHVISLFSTATPLPHEHTVTPIFPDDEGGEVERFYKTHRILTAAYERAKPEASHPGFAEHAHSYIKMIVELSNNGSGERGCQAGPN